MATVSVEKILKPHKSKLGALVAGTSGSGKTTGIIALLRQAILSPKFDENFRFVIIDPKIQKGDYDLLADPVRTTHEAIESIQKNRTTVYWPDYPEFDQKTLQKDISILLDYIFHASDLNPEVSFTVVIDEASVLITPTQIPSALKRLSVQGRAKRILPIYISQRPLTNRWLDSNVSRILLWRMLPVDSDNLSKRFGIDFDTFNERIADRPYSFAIFNLETAKLRTVAPVELPKKIPRPKKTWSEKVREIVGL